MNTVQSGKSFLEHYGIRGMKWGVRRRSKYSGGKSKGPKSLDVKNLSDKELRDIVNRMNLEQQYSRLSGSGSQNPVVAAGAAFLGGIALNIARQQIQNQANARIASALSAKK